MPTSIPPSGNGAPCWIRLFLNKIFTESPSWINLDPKFLVFTCFDGDWCRWASWLCLDCRCDPMPTLWERRGWVKSPYLSFCIGGTRLGEGGCLTCGTSLDGSSGSWWHSTLTEIGFSISVEDAWPMSLKFIWIFTYCRWQCLLLHLHSIPAVLFRCLQSSTHLDFPMTGWTSPFTLI